jgi:hypothetical protein
MGQDNGDWGKVVRHPRRVVDGNGEYIVEDAPLFGRARGGRWRGLVGGGCVSVFPKILGG